MTKEEIKRALEMGCKLLNESRANVVAEAKAILNLPGVKMKQKDKARFAELTAYVDGLDYGLDMITAVVKEMDKGE